MMIEDRSLKQKPQRFSPQKGHCLYCRAKIDHGSFCDELCKEDYDFEQEIRVILGKPKKD